MTSMRSVVLDNGAGSIKYGIGGEKSPRIMSNCTARMQNSMNELVGDEVDAFNNHSLLKYTRPFDRGYLVNWRTEIDVWNRIFDVDHLNISPMNHSLVVTEPFLNPLEFQNEMNEVVFEDYRFESCCRRPAVCFLEHYFQQQHDKANAATRHGCMLVVDSGFSFTHIVPFIDHKAVRNSSTRIDIGGKLLTNFLKEMISFRQMNVMDDFKLINQFKEQACAINEDNIFKSPKFHGGFSDTPKVFVLPDFQETFHGVISDREIVDSSSHQFLKMGTEYTNVPEICFSPADIQMNQQGVAEAASTCLYSFPKVEASLMCENIFLVGGNMNFLNLGRKFQVELQGQVESHDLVRVAELNDDSVLASWNGASIFAELAMNDTNVFSTHFITRYEYEEYGHDYCNHRFQLNW